MTITQPSGCRTLGSLWRNCAGYLVDGVGRSINQAHYPPASFTEGNLDTNRNDTVKPSNW